MTFRPSSAAPILAVLAVVLVMLGMYTVAYVALVRRTDKPLDFVIVEGELMYGPQYRIGGAFSDFVFTPAYRVDLMLRPRYWGRRPADPYDVEVFP